MKNEKPSDEQSEPNTIAFTVWTWGKALAISQEKLNRGLTAIGIHPGRGEKITAVDIFKSLYGDKDAALARKANADAEAVERKNREAAGELIDVEESAKIYGDKMQAIIERLDAMPAMLDSRLAAETSPLIVRQILTEYNEQTKTLARKSMEK